MTRPRGVIAVKSDRVRSGVVPAADNPRPHCVIDNGCPWRGVGPCRLHPKDWLDWGIRRPDRTYPEIRPKEKK